MRNTALYMSTITFFTDSEHPQLSHGDQALRRAFERQGISISVCAWEDDIHDPVDCQGIIRSTWNYQFFPEVFLQWVASFDQMKRHVCNSPETVRWNIDKRYMIEIASSGVETIPTFFLESGSVVSKQLLMERCLSSDIVLKPVIGNSAFGIQLVTDKEEVIREPMLAQPIIFDPSNEEVSVVVINGTVSHAVKKIPRHDDFRANTTHGAVVVPGIARPEIAALALKAWNCVPGRPFFARIDICTDRGTPVVSEIEVIEPGLFFDHAPQDAADRFVSSYCQRYL